MIKVSNKYDKNDVSVMTENSLEDDKKLEEEKTDLLGKIDNLKKQIKAFENELGINTEDLVNRPSVNDSKVLQKMRESEGQLKVIENLVRNETAFPKPQVLESGNAIVEQPPEIKGQAPVLSMEDVQRRALELKQKSRQISEISSMVSQLRKDVVLEKPSLKQQATTEAASAPQAQKSITTKLETQKLPVQPVYSAKDVPSLDAMLQKLNTLVKENAELSEELREMINETKNVNKANKVSDLVRKLALVGLNG